MIETSRARHGNPRLLLFPRLTANKHQQTGERWGQTRYLRMAGRLWLRGGDFKFILLGFHCIRIAKAVKADSFILLKEVALIRPCP